MRTLLSFPFKVLAAVAFWLLMRIVAGRRAPDFTIGNDPSNPYMRRWFVIPRNRFFNVYLHQILRDDEDRALHDHPWSSLSLCLYGAVGEVYRAPEGDRRRVASAGDFVYRGKQFAHRLFLTDGPAWTLFMTGPRVREWGFLCGQDTAAGGWRSWREFTAARELGEAGKGHIGRGCD